MVASIAQNIYIASRGISCGLNSEPIDFSNVKACSPDDGDDIYDRADAAEQQGKWLVAFIPSLEMTRNLWVGTFGAAVEYIHETSSATIAVIYDQPLTIRSNVPSDWARVRVQQGGNATEVQSTVEGMATVIYYNAVPDRGLISLRNPQAGDPRITALLPFFVPAGSPGFMLQVTGSNFMPGSVLRWNGSDRATTFVSSIQLNVSISEPTSPTREQIPSRCLITVYTPPPGGGVSNAVNFDVYPAIVFVSLIPSSVVGGSSSTGTVTLDGPAPAGGAAVSLSSDNTSVASVPATVTVPGSATSATFTVTTVSVPSPTSTGISAVYASQTQVATLNVLETPIPPPTGVTFTPAPSPPSPQSPGTSVTFTAAGEGGSGIYEYKFWLRDPAGAWTLGQDYPPPGAPAPPPGYGIAGRGRRWAPTWSRCGSEAPDRSPHGRRSQPQAIR